jgi:hypothetical protein
MGSATTGIDYWTNVLSPHAAERAIAALVEAGTNEAGIKGAK